MIAQDSGNRLIASHLAAVLCRVEANYGDPMAALEYFRMAIHNHYESGSITMVSTPLAVLAAFFARHGRYESAATLAGFAFGPVTAVTFPELETAIVHLRDVLGEADLRIARPQRRDDDHRRHGDLRIRPNRPGPSRTRTPWLKCYRKMLDVHILPVLGTKPVAAITKDDVREWHAVTLTKQPAFRARCYGLLKPWGRRASPATDRKGVRSRFQKHPYPDSAGSFVPFLLTVVSTLYVHPCTPRVLVLVPQHTVSFRQVPVLQWCTRRSNH